MTTAQLYAGAKNIVQKIEHLKETDTVCHACEVLKLTAYVVLPVIIPLLCIRFRLFTSRNYNGDIVWYLDFYIIV